MSVVLCCCCKSETLLSPEGAPPTLEFSHPESVFQVWSWLPLGVWWCLRPLQRNLMVTIITTVTRTRAVATPPKMLIMGWKLLDWGLGLGLPWLPWCSGDVDNGFSSPCSLNVLSENRKEKILVKVLNHDQRQWFFARPKNRNRVHIIKGSLMQGWVFRLGYPTNFSHYFKEL